MLGIDYPIFSVGFAESAGPELVSAVSNAGGFGVLGFSGVPEREVSRRIARVRALTSRPFGGNVIIAAFELKEATENVKAVVRDRIATVIAERVSVLVLFWGDPAPFVKPAHANGVKVFIQTGSLEEAKRAAESLGTRFVASEEAWVHRAHKDLIVSSRSEDTVHGIIFDVGW